jgi:hypothetical protein
MAASGALAASHGRDATPVAISPAPGTPDASPTTQISILGTAPDQLRSVRVDGSMSGLHRGAFHPYSGRRGASFVLSRPLEGGEHVSVTVRFAHRGPRRFSFTVARLAPTPLVIKIPKEQPSKLDHFVTAPGLLAPRIFVRKGATPGDIFLTPLPSPEIHPESNNALTINPVGPGGPMIIDGHGRLVWFKQLAAPTVATNLKLQRYNGHQVLTWWQGKVTVAAFGLGEGVIANRRYHTVKVVHVGNGYAADLHEFRLEPGGDALFTVNSLVMMHLPGTKPGALSPVLDSMLQEVDIRTGLVMWEWHALGHIPLSDSYATPATSAYFDAYHMNSIEPLPHDRLLVSARDTSAIYEIDRATGRIIWKLGGKASSFRMGPGSRFYFQHDASMLPGNRVSLFDDEAGPPIEQASSRGLILTLDLRHHRASVAHSYRRPAGGLANSEGSFQTLPGGNVFVGFGSAGFFSEFSPSGALVFDARLPVDDGSYRQYTYPWSTTPTTRPSVAVRTASPGQVAVYASWNGATRVARWQVLARTPTGALKPVGSASAHGFETRIAVRSSATRFAVRALEAHGKALATSAAVEAS